MRVPMASVGYPAESQMSDRLEYSFQPVKISFRPVKISFSEITLEVFSK